jgi:diguanylate cyclase (GGDEF)-like protein/PAS domain S-box-containing protein
MLVEDERIVAFDLKRQLQCFGYTVSAVVASGEQAIIQIDAQRPDLVLMDIHLEGHLDGIEAANQIRAKHQVPVIFLTAYAEDDTLRRALDSRPFGYLIKPCEGRELHATIQMALARREDEIAVEQSEERLQLALNAGSLGVIEWSPASNRMQGDLRLGKLFGNQLLPLDESWETFIARVDTEDRERVQAALNPTLINAEAVQVEFRTHGDNTLPHHIEAFAKAYGSAGAVLRVVGILRDVTQRHKDDEQMRQSSVVFHATAEAIVITDAEHRAVAVNTSFSRITGHTENEVIGRNPEILLRVTPGPERFTTCLAAGGSGFWQGEVNCQRKSGEAFPAWQSVSTVRNVAGRITHFVSAFSDVTAIYDAQQKLHHLAHHDPLTGLPNRLLFNDRLENAIELAGRNGKRCLLLFLDLDGFKLINDTLGHAVGDQLLSQVGERLRNVLRSSDTIARVGGDEFVVLAGSTNPDYAVQLAKKILEQLRLPIMVAGQSISISGSLGIAVFPENGTDPQQLMRAADMAMYTAKAEGRNRYHFYAECMSKWATERLDVEQGLRRAISTDNLLVYYQPRVDLASRRIVGVEALVRWQHPERGLVFPSDFITIAEDSDLIEELGQWVLRRASREMLDFVLNKVAGEHFHLAVNVSARQFLSADFVAVVKSALEETGFPAAALELEITESTLQVAERSLLILENLEEIGVSISIDDFGMGYSSLSVLRDMPIKRIKIDRSFIVDLPSSENQRAVVEAIVALSRAMHMSITVEGIERPEQADLLQEMGCEEGQGYLFAPPIPFDEFTRMIQQPSKMGTRTKGKLICPTTTTLQEDLP